MKRDSWQLIASESSEEFVSALSREALEHPAVHHEYLKRLASGDVPDLVGALCDYAFQYAFYGSEFPSYVEGVLGGLHSPEHRNVLKGNLEEEKGCSESENIDEMPHTKIFDLFKSAVGATREYEEKSTACTTVMIWRDLFLQKCQSRQAGLGIGAIGIGTEMVVPTMYSYILRSIRDHTELSERDYYFFPLHMECDMEHSEELITITRELSSDYDVREAIRFGVFSSLNLRKAFWDVMLSRAMQMDGVLR